MCLRLVRLFGFLNSGVLLTRLTICLVQKQQQNFFFVWRQMYKLRAMAAAAAAPRVAVSLRRCESATLTALIRFSIISLCSSNYAPQSGVESKTHNIAEHQRNQLTRAHVHIRTVTPLQPCYHKLIYSCVHTDFLCVFVFVCVCVCLCLCFLASRASAFGTCNCFDFLWPSAVIIGSAVCLTCQQPFFCVCVCVC